jgi:formylglycine-generating enzyme required for sulfatase activity
MLCGRVPFNSPVSTAVVVQHVNQPPQSLRTINTGISPQVEAVVFHALEKRRAARPPTAGALAQELTAAVHSTSAAASHATWPQMSGPLQPPAHNTEETVMWSGARTPASNEMPATLHLPAAQPSGPTAAARSTVPSGSLSVTRPNQRLLMKIGAVLFGCILFGTVVAIIMWSLTRQRRQKPNQEPIGTTNLQQTTMPATFKNKIGMQFLLMPAGAFLMGSSEVDVEVAFADAERTNSGAKREWFNSETPQHRVTIKRAFYIGKFEVTQSQWRALIVGNDPSRFRDCASCPVEQVSWYDAQEFIKKLNEMSDGYMYSLPSEAQWEYACRAGTTMAFAFGDSLSSSQGNFNGKHPYGSAPEGAWVKKTTPVGSYQPNAWGLCDMHGNVYEWVEDIWADSYNGLSVDGSANANGGDPRYRVLRGGSWTNHAKYCRSAYRNRVAPDYRSLDSGFRVVAVTRE